MTQPNEPTHTNGPRWSTGRVLVTVFVAVVVALVVLLGGAWLVQEWLVG